LGEAKAQRNLRALEYLFLLPVFCFRLCLFEGGGAKGKVGVFRLFAATQQFGNGEYLDFSVILAVL